MKRFRSFQSAELLAATVLLVTAILLSGPPAVLADILPFEPDDTLEEIRYKIDYNGYAFTVAQNWVFDMSPEGKAAFFSRHRPLSPRPHSQHDQIGPLARYLGKKNLPASFDWRNRNGRSYIGPIRNQGDCGSCFAFGAAAAAEGTYNWATGKYDQDRVDFSEAFLAFCLSDHYSGFSGCSGANYDYDEMQALVDYGVTTESQYPYSDFEQSCPFANYPPLTQFQSWHRIPCNDIEAIKTAIMTYGVVDVAVYVGSAFQAYSGGIYQDSNVHCDGIPCAYTTSNHAVALVGWNDNDGDGYWILRNSWGTGWGEGGYMRIRYTSAVVACAAAYLVYQPAPRTGPLKIQTFNVSRSSTFAGDQTIRIFQGLSPDIALIQEWALSEGTYRDYVDEAFGPDFHLFVGDDPGGTIGNPWSQNNGIVSRWALQTFGNWQDTISSGRPTFAWAEIDLPGETDLLAVSVHLKAGASSGEVAERTQQAQLIKGYVESFITDQGFDGYIIIGGDCNAESPFEPPILLFDSFLQATSHRPIDRLGSPNTNQLRTKPYDWLMPNQRLDNFHTTLVIGAVGYQYPEGIVFDSQLFWRGEPAPTPASDTVLWNLPPVRYGDSYTSLVDHMAVMKAYDIFPSPSPSPITTATPVPSATPKPTPRRTPTPRPSATPEIVMGPIWGRVYDRETGVGIPRIYVQAVGGGMGAGIYTTTDRNGYYSIRTLNIGTYLVWADAFEQAGYRGQFYNQKNTESQATRVDSNTGGIDFPLYRRGVYPTPPPTPTPVLLPSAIDTADYDGDGTSDIAVFRPASGLWAVKGLTRFYYGRSGDLPVSGDYTGDGTSNPAIFRGSSGLWAVRSATRFYYGRSGDIPVPGDYSGFGGADFAVFRPASGLWAIRHLTRIYFGRFGDLPAPFTAGGWEKEIAIFRPATGLWAVRGATRAYFGATRDIPVPGNYQGLLPGAIQFGVFRGSSGLWAIRGLTRVYHGARGDRPVPGNYAGKIQADVTVFQENSGIWAVRGLTRLYFGRFGDLPASGLAVNPSGTIAL